VDEIEKGLDEFLAGDDGLENVDWCNYADQLEKLTAEYFREPITRQRLDELIRRYAKSYSAFLKSNRMMAHICASSGVNKIRSGYIKAGLETIKNYEASDEMVMKYVDELPGKVRSETAKKGGMKSKPDALQKLILGMVKEKPKLSVSKLTQSLEAQIGMGIIEDVSEGVISFVENGKPIVDSPISGLKDRLSRAKKSILEENKSR